MGVGVSLMVNVWLVAANPGILPNGFENLFEACEYRYTGGTHHDELHRYRLFVPRHLDPAERYPLLVWMHGTGENGTDNVSSLRWLDRVLEFPAQIERYRFFILVVQCPDTRRDWSPVVEGGDDMLAVTFAILQKSLAEQPIDPDRVYLSGVSSGATACWELAMRHPETFAAVVPMGSAGGDLSRVDRLVQIPIWVFHNFNDTKTPRRGDEETVAALQAAGGNTLLTCVSTPGHNCWKHAFLSYGIMEWLLQQHRGAWICGTPPGHPPWKWWQVWGVPAGFLLVVVLGGCSERRRRQRRTVSVTRAPEELAAVGGQADRPHGAPCCRVGSPSELRAK